VITAFFEFVRQAVLQVKTKKGQLISLYWGLMICSQQLLAQFKLPTNKGSKTEE